MKDNELKKFFPLCLVLLKKAHLFVFICVYFRYKVYSTLMGFINS